MTVAECVIFGCGFLFVAGMALFIGEKVLDRFLKKHEGAEERLDRLFERLF